MDPFQRDRTRDPFRVQNQSPIAADRGQWSLPSSNIGTNYLGPEVTSPMPSKQSPPWVDRERSPLPPLDYGSVTASFALGGLVCVGVAGIACIIGGAITFSSPSVVTVSIGSATHTAALQPGLATIADGTEIWALLSTIALTFIAEATGFVHSVCLRWNLWQERRLTWSTSLRLLTTSRASFSTSTFSNLVYFLTLGLAFTASSQIFVRALISPGYTVNDSAADGSSWDTSYSLANGAALITLGVCLGVQAGLVSWIYFASRKNIKTWSSSPLTIALACAAFGGNASMAYSGKHSSLASAAMRRAQSKNSNGDIAAKLAVTPKQKQESLLTTRRKGSALVLGSLSLLVVLIAVWAGIVINAFKGARLDVSGNELDSDNSKIEQLATSALWQEAPSIQLFAWQQNGSTTAPPMPTSSTLFLCLLLVFCIQALLTFALHSAELVCNAFRDQRAWEQAARHVRSWRPSQRGASLNPTATSLFIRSPPNMVLVACKVLAHWLFNRCLLPLMFIGARVNPDDGTDRWQTSETQIQLFGLPTLVLAAVMLLLLLMALYLTLRRPSTPQPATYGHLPTLLDVVDEWGFGEPLFWGDKGVAEDGVHRRAGTAARIEEVGPVQFESRYV